MIYDAFAHLPIYGLEDLGFLPRGEAAAFIAARNTAPGGKLPLNTNGGGLSYMHSGMYGMYALQESVRQMRGIAAAQVPDAQISVCHGVGGMFAASGTIIFTNPRRRSCRVFRLGSSTLVRVFNRPVRTILPISRPDPPARVLVILWLAFSSYFGLLLRHPPARVLVTSGSLSQLTLTCYFVMAGLDPRYPLHARTLAVRADFHGAAVPKVVYPNRERRDCRPSASHGLTPAISISTSKHTAWTGRGRGLAMPSPFIRGEAAS